MDYGSKLLWITFLIDYYVRVTREIYKINNILSFFESTEARKIHIKYKISCVCQRDETRTI